MEREAEGFGWGLALLQLTDMFCGWQHWTALLMRAMDIQPLKTNK